MRDFVLNECNYGSLESLDIDLAILPWGATEPHNYHLPYGTDTMETSYIAITAASKAKQKGAKVMVLPTIPLGMQNPGQVDIPFCLNASILTQKSILEDIVDSLSQQGINKLLVLNGHGGNDFKAIIRELSVSLEDFFLGQSNWYEILDNNKYFDFPGDHAGEMETSIMMYAYPDLVDDISKAGKGDHKQFSAKCLREKKVWTPRNWSEVSGDTGIGNPRAATAEKGEKFIADLTDELANIYIELCNTDINKLYED